MNMQSFPLGVVCHRVSSSSVVIADGNTEVAVTRRVEAAPVVLIVHTVQLSYAVIWFFSRRHFTRSNVLTRELDVLSST